MASTKGIGIGVFIIILLAVILTNTSAFFPANEVSKVQTTMIIYSLLFLFGMVLVLALGKQVKTRIFNTPWYVALFQFGLGFLVTAVIVVVFVPPAFAGSLEPFSASIALIGAIIYIFIKAFIEEFFFRDTLEDLIGRWKTAGLFGMFHFAVLSITGAAFLSIFVGALFLAFLGLVWSYLKDIQWFGIMGATGSHTAWNAHAFKLIAHVFGG